MWTRSFGPGRMNVHLFPVWEVTILLSDGEPIRLDDYPAYRIGFSNVLFYISLLLIRLLSLPSSIFYKSRSRLCSSNLSQKRIQGMMQKFLLFPLFLVTLTVHASTIVKNATVSNRHLSRCDNYQSFTSHH